MIIRRKIKEFDESHHGIDINNLLKERDDYKQSYIEEIKTSRKIKSTIQSQQMLLTTKKIETNLFKIKNNTSYGFFNAKKTH